MAADEGRRRFLKQLWGLAATTVVPEPVGQLANVVAGVASPERRISALAETLKSYFEAHRTVKKFGATGGHLDAPEVKALDDLGHMRLADLGGGALHTIQFHIRDREEELRALKPTRGQIMAAIDEIKKSHPRLSDEAKALQRMRIEHSSDTITRLREGHNYNDIARDHKAVMDGFSQAAREELHDASLSDAVRELFPDEKLPSALAEVHDLTKDGYEFHTSISHAMNQIGVRDGEALIDRVTSIAEMPEAEYQAEWEKARKARERVEQDRRAYEEKKKAQMSIAPDSAAYRALSWPGHNLPDQMICGEEVKMQGRRKLEHRRTPLEPLWPAVEGKPAMTHALTVAEISETYGSRNESWAEAAEKRKNTPDKWSRGE
jgi:hypothetical protein